LAGRRGGNPARTIEKRPIDPIRTLLAARNPKFSVATDRTRPQPGLTQKSSPVQLLPAESLIDYARQIGQHWMQGIGVARELCKMRPKPG
jgi:hypothetical protein